MFKAVLRETLLSATTSLLLFLATRCKDHSIDWPSMGSLYTTMERTGALGIWRTTCSCTAAILHATTSFGLTACIHHTTQGVQCLDLHQACKHFPTRTPAPSSRRPCLGHVLPHIERSHLYWDTNLCSPHHPPQPSIDPQWSLRSERGNPRSAPMHYLRTHAGQGMADRQGRWQTGGRGTPRLGLLRQDSRRGRNLFGKWGED